jgi:hypothetical protein
VAEDGYGDLLRQERSTVHVYWKDRSMKEMKIHADFDTAFHQFPLLKPNEKVGGWPDRGIQVSAQLVWCEIKQTILRSNGTILLSNVEKEQAAFLYKWQRNGGYCFLLVGIVDRNDTLSCYVTIRPKDYKQWLTVRHQMFAPEHLGTFENMRDVLTWFKYAYVIPR